LTPTGNVASTDLQSAIAELDTEKMPKVGGAFTGDITVPNEAYGVGWNGDLTVPTKSAIYSKIESMPTSVPSVFGRT
jgi:hypothetical protein